MDRHGGGGSASRARAALLFLTGVSLLVYGVAQWYDYAPSLPWFVHGAAGIVLFAWGINQLRNV